MEAFERYLGLAGATITRVRFEANLEEKVCHRGFRSDLDPMLVAPPAADDVDAAAALIRAELLSRLR